MSDFPRFFSFSFFFSPWSECQGGTKHSLRLFQPKINSEKNGTDRPIAREAEKKPGDSSYVCKTPIDTGSGEKGGVQGTSVINLESI